MKKKAEGLAVFHTCDPLSSFQILKRCERIELQFKETGREDKLIVDTVWLLSGSSIAKGQHHYGEKQEKSKNLKAEALAEDTLKLRRPKYMQSTGRGNVAKNR